MARSRLFLMLTLVGILLLSVAGVAQAQTTSDTGSSGGDVTIGVRSVLHSGEAYSDEFQPGATAYLYGFTGSKGDVVSISMTQKEGSDLDPFVVLLGPKGEVLASDDDSGTDIFGSSLISDKKLPDDGIYLVVASTFAHIDEILVESGQETAEPTDQTFDITVTGNTEPASIGDNSLISVTRLAKGEAHEDTSTLEIPVGYYVYDGKAGDTISVTTKSDEFDTVLHVFDPDGNRIAVNDTDPQSTDSVYNAGIHDLTLPKDGTYMIFATDIFFYNAGVEDTQLPFTGGKYTVAIE